MTAGPNIRDAVAVQAVILTTGNLKGLPDPASVGAWTHLGEPHVHLRFDDLADLHAWADELEVGVVFGHLSAEHDQHTASTGVYGATVHMAAAVRRQVAS